MRKLQIVVCFFVSLFVGMVGNVFCLEWQLPFPGGTSLTVTRAYNNSTHIDYGYYDMDDRYALDFVGYGCSSFDSPILAIADGIILEIHNQDDGGYGKYVIVDHGGGYHSRYAHLNTITVGEGEVSQGEQIGTMGNTGFVSGTSCPEHPGTHLHFALYLNGDAYKPEPISGYTNFVIGEDYVAGSGL